VPAGKSRVRIRLLNLIFRIFLKDIFMNIFVNIFMNIYRLIYNRRNPIRVGVEVRVRPAINSEDDTSTITLLKSGVRG